MSSSTAKALLLSKSKNQQSSSINHCNDLSRTSWTNDKLPSLSSSSKPTTTHPKSPAISSSLSTAAAVASTAVTAVTANDTTNKKILHTGLLAYECLGLDAASGVLCRVHHEAMYNSTVSSSLSTTAIAATANATDSTTNNHCNTPKYHNDEGATSINNNTSGSLTSIPPTPVRNGPEVFTSSSIAAIAAAADGTTNNHCNLNHCNDGASTTNNNSSGSLTPVRRHNTAEGRENDEKQSLQSPTTFQYKKSPEDDGKGKLCI